MISLFFLGLLLLTFLWNLYYARHWSTNLSASLNFMQNFVYAGEQTQISEQIENRKKLMLPVLEVAFHMDKKLSFHDYENISVSDFTYKRDIFALLGFQRITRKLTLDCPRRGYYRIDSLDLTTFSMLHSRRYCLTHPADTELYVYAARTNISDILFTCERLMGSMQCAKRLFEDPFAFSSIREYTVADPMNTINWKASARTGALMVNTFESTLTKQVMIYLDVEDSGILKYEYLIEESISIAASLARKLIGSGMEVGICVNIDKDNLLTQPDKTIEDIHGKYQETTPILSIKPACSNKQLTYIEQTLSKYKSQMDIVPFTKLYTDSPTVSFEDAAMIVISKNTALNQTAIENLIGHKRQAVWVVPYTIGDNCNVRTTNNIRVIKRAVTVN